MAGLFDLVDPALGGASGATNIVGGVQEGDLGQVAGGAYEGLGAYVAASSAYVYQQGLEKAAELGLEGAAASEYASTYIGSGFPGTATISQWLPYIGVGLTVYDIIKNGPNIWNLGPAAAATLPSMLSTIVRGYMAYGAFKAFKGWRKKEKWEHGKKRVFFLNSELTPIHTDESGFVYLKVSDGIEPGGFDWGSKARDYGANFMFRYNPKTNSLQYTKDKLPISEMDSCEWKEFDANDPISIGHSKRHVLLWNVPQLQASIHNNVLVPEGLAPQITADSEGWNEVTIGGVPYLTDGNYITDSSGYIAGTLNSDTGEFYDFNIYGGGWRWNKEFTAPRDDKPPPYNVLGTVDDWKQVKQSLEPSLFGPSATAEALLPDYPVQGTQIISESRPLQPVGGLFPSTEPQQPVLQQDVIFPPIQPSGGLFPSAPGISQQTDQTSFFPSGGGSNITGTQTTPPIQPSGGLGLGGSNMSIFGTTDTQKDQGKFDITKAPGPLPAGGDVVWEQYLNSVFGSPAEGEPTYLASALAGQQAHKDQASADYVRAIEQSAMPYNQAVDAAKAKPINISFGGRPVGNVMMGGGVAMEKERMGVNMLAPAAEYDYAQQNTPYTAYLNYVNYLGGTGMEMQKLAYGIPSTAGTGVSERETEKEPSIATQVDNWLNIAGGVYDFGSEVYKAGKGTYNAGQSWGWW